jgi:hypothetical protein
MLFYSDPFSSKRFEKVAEWNDDSGQNHVRIRLMYNRQEKNLVLFQEVYGRGNMNNSSVELSPVTAIAMFSNHGARINELLVEPYEAPANSWDDF